MNSMLLKSLHRHTGIALSVIMFVVSLTGVLLIWKPEYIAFSHSQARQTVDRDPRSIARVLEKIGSHFPRGDIRLIQVHHENLALYKVMLTDKRYAWFSQQGKKLEQWQSNERFEDWLLDLHHRLLMGNSVGLQIVGFGGMILVLLVLLGAFIFWPRRKTFAVGLWPKSKKRGGLIVSHGNLGISSLLPVLVVVISGVILVYPRQSSEILLPDSAVQSNAITLASDDPRKSLKTPIKETDLDAMLAYVHTRFPQSTIRWFIPPNDEYPSATIGLQQSKGLNRVGNTSVTFKPNQSITVRDALAQTRAKRFFDFIFVIHTAKLPLWYRLILTVFGLALMFVSLLALVSYSKWLLEKSK